jgi:hypothetical protein
MGWALVCIIGVGFAWLLMILKVRLQKILEAMGKIGEAMELQTISPRPINEAYRLTDEMLTTRTAMAAGFGALNRTGEKANEKLEAIAAEMRKAQGR